MKRTTARITVAYTPGHSGISYKTRADHLAGEAVPIGDLIHTPGDIIFKINNNIVESDQLVQNELWSVERLQERGWDYGTASSIRERGWDCAFHNQRELGVLTRGTLRRMLEGGGQHTSQCHYSSVANKQTNK